MEDNFRPGYGFAYFRWHWLRYGESGTHCPGWRCPDACVGCNIDWLRMNPTIGVSADARSPGESGG